MGRETYIKAGTTLTLIQVKLDLIPIQIIYEKQRKKWNRNRNRKGNINSV